MNNFQRNLLNIINERGISVQKASELCDIPFETMKSIVYRKDSNPRLDNIIKISKGLGVTVSDLVGDRDNSEEYLVESYRMCSKRAKNIIISFCEKYALKGLNERDKLSSVIPIIVPISHLQDGITDNMIKYIYVKCSNPNVFTGYMINTYNFTDYGLYEGDVILLERRKPIIGDLSVFSDGDTSYLRKLDKEQGEYVLKAINPNGNDIHTKDFKGIKCIGVVIDTIRSDDLEIENNI